MKLFLLRHATAVETAATDAVRALSPRGEQEAIIAGRALATLGAAGCRIFCSPYLRTRQTAGLVARAMAAPEPRVMDELLNGSTTEELLWTLKKPVGPGDVLLVGHMPSLGGHLAELLGRTPLGGFAFTPAGAAGVELPVWQLGTGVLLWHKSYVDLAKAAPVLS